MEEKFVKITNAVYKILDCLPDSDPLKNKAKEKALAILENLVLVSQAQGWVSLQKEKASLQLLDDIEVLENYLTIGKYQGWIDDMNFLIITTQYRQVKKGINPPKGMILQSMEIASRIPVVSNSPEAKKYSQRQEKILKILHGREKAQVSDFIKELPNITKRTVRRDLDDLLKRGKIRRIGEWNQVFYTKVDRTNELNFKLS